MGGYSDDDVLPNALSAMSIDDRPSSNNTAGARGGDSSTMIGVAGSSDSLAGVVDGERVDNNRGQQSSILSDGCNNHRQDLISPPPSSSAAQHHHHQQHVAASSPKTDTTTSHSAAAQHQQMHQQTQITIDDIPPDMREAFIQLDPEQQALALEMLAQQQQQQQQQQMEEEMATSRPEEHFLTIALNGKIHI